MANGIFFFFILALTFVYPRISLPHSPFFLFLPLVDFSLCSGTFPFSSSVFRGFPVSTQPYLFCSCMVYFISVKRDRWNGEVVNRRREKLGRLEGEGW